MNSPNNLFALARTNIGVAADECMSKDLKIRINNLYTDTKNPSCDLAMICDKLSDIHKATHDPLVKTFLAKAIDLIDDMDSILTTE
tara:strand:- start:307 stop:564 length:258 start_codon:yes stop_codon:yes gene_type:complete